MNLFDMLANAQNGQGMDQLARQFGLSQQQTQAAVEALLPAFQPRAEAKRLGPLWRRFASSARWRAATTRNISRTRRTRFRRRAWQKGNGILGHLFGSKDLSRAVASQAAQATGLGQQTLQQMLPVIASMIMGGLFKQSTNQLNPSSQAAGFGGSGNPLQEIIEQMMRQGGGHGHARTAAAAAKTGAAAAAGTTGRPVRQSVRQDPEGHVRRRGSRHAGRAAAGSAAAGSPAAPGGTGARGAGSQNPFGDNPLGKIFEEMMKGAQGGGQAGTQTADSRPPIPEPRGREPKTGPGGRPKNPYDDLFGEMFETGAKQRDEYQKGVESIFDQFSKGNG